MDASQDKYMERLAEILGRKKGFLREILDLTGSQTGAIDAEDLDRLKNLIDEKQARIDAIDKLDEEFNVYFQRLKSAMKIKSLAELDTKGSPKALELKETTAGILKLITDIGEIEKANSGKSKKLLDSMSERIRKLNQGKKVNSAYTPAPLNVPSYFIDRKK